MLIGVGVYVFCIVYSVYFLDIGLSGLITSFGEERFFSGIDIVFCSGGFLFLLVLWKVCVFYCGYAKAFHIIISH